MRLARYCGITLFAALLASCAIGVRQEIDLGRRYAAQLEREMPMVHVPAIQADLDLITARLTPFARRREIAYRFTIVNSDAVNAFAVPGGYIYVTRALIENAASMDQLAGVLGHEMGHVELRHSAKQIGRAQAAETGIGVVGVLLGRQPNQAVQAGVSVAGQLVFARFSRDQEREADEVAVGYVTEAGINPGGIVGMFETLQSLERSRPSALESFFASHPMAADRMTEVNALIARTPASQALLATGTRDAPEFQRLKAAVRQLPPPPDRRPPTPK
ncbi:MAG: M48 family metallopeptidase [Gemmatimonadota bacterium]